MPLAAEQARRVYDRIGRAQDTQRFYEDAPTARVAEVGRFAEARATFELGCGTGRFAASLLGERLPGDARYLGVDVSPAMVRIARGRLAAFEPRAAVELLEPPAVELPGTAGGFDRFLATYVFDLLAPGHANLLLAQARRLLAPSGLLCLVGLTRGVTPAGRVVSGGWSALARRWPALVGGCRPVEMAPLLAAGGWRVEHREVITRWGVPSEVVVARPAS